MNNIEANLPAGGRNGERKVSLLILWSNLSGQVLVDKPKEGEKRGKKRLVCKAKQLSEKHEPFCNDVRGATFKPIEILPEPGKNILKFKSTNLLFKCPLWVYADFECALVDVFEQVGYKTTRVQKHVPITFSIKFDLEVKALQFVRKLWETSAKIYKAFPNPV